MLTAGQTGPLAYPRAPRVRGHPTAPRPTSRTRLWSRARPPGHCTGQELSLGAVLEFETGLKRAEQAQRCSPARSCCCYSLEPRGHGPGGPKSRALLRVSDATFGGPGSEEGMGEGPAAEEALRVPAAHGLPAGRIRWGRCPAAPPARPRRSDHGLFLWGAGLESGPRRLRGRSGNSAHCLAAIGGHAPERKARTRLP